MGDLRALIREIIIRTLKTAQAANGSIDEQAYATSYAFANNKLITLTNPASATNKTTKSMFNMSNDLAYLFKTIVENEEEFYIKLFTNGQELTTQSPSASMLIDAKKLADVGLKDMQSIHVSLFNRLNNSNVNKPVLNRIDRHCVPMLLLSEEAHFNSLFDLLNMISQFDLSCLSHALVGKSELLCSKLWDIILVLPTNQACYKLLGDKLEYELSNMASQYFSDSTLQDGHVYSPYKLLYYLQIIEILSKQDVSIR